VNVRLESLETKVDQRLRETRPVWENVLAQLTKLKKEVVSFALRPRVGFAESIARLAFSAKNMVDMTAEIQEWRDLIEKPESQPA